jgi:hypothetical protein
MKTLSFKKETLRTLVSPELDAVAGGAPADPGAPANPGAPAQPTYVTKHTVTNNVPTTVRAETAPTTLKDTMVLNHTWFIDGRQGQ